MMKTILVRFAITFLAVSGAVLAQTSAASQKMELMQKMTAEPEMQVNFLSTELADTGDVVKGAPYTATVTTESSQVLADGNRIVRKSSGMIARDSEGRMRREEVIKVGPLQLDGYKAVFINDPVSKTNYVLNPDTQSARVVKPEGWTVSSEGDKTVVTRARRKAPEGADAAPPPEPRRGNAAEGGLKREELGTQVIEGVPCEGVRITRTIPAGIIGNERPIDIVVETWESPDLHVPVLRKRSDPRLGETIYQLTNIKRGEPDASLFQVPSGYSIEKGIPRMPPPPPPGGAKE